MYKNRPLRQTLQVISVAVSLALLLSCLYLFRYFCLRPMPLAPKIFCLVIIDRAIACAVWLLKLCLCYDYYLAQPFYLGCFSQREPIANTICNRVTLFLVPIIWGVFFFTRTNFILQVLIIASLLIGWIWAYHYIEHRTVRAKQQINKKKKLLSGIVSTELKASEITSLNGYGFKLTTEVIGFGVFGTVYKCGWNRNEEELVLKVIDFNDWIINRNPLNQRLHDQIEAIRTAFHQIAHKLRALKHKNVCQYLRVHNNPGPFTRVFLISRMAQMNLDYFLTNIRPSGVSEQWAREWFRQLADGVHYLHEVFENNPFPHSAIKPENILLFRRHSDKGVDHSNRSTENEIEMKDEFDLKLSDCGIESFLPLKGKVITKRDPILVISPPKNVSGKKNLRILRQTERTDEQKFNDIYQLAVVLLLLNKGDVNRLIKSPKDTERLDYYVTGVDGIYVRFDKIENIKKLPGIMSTELLHLLKRMTEYEPIFRYDINQVLSHKWLNQTTGQ